MMLFPTHLKSALFQYLLLAPQTDLSPSAEQRKNPCSGPSPVYQDLITRFDWPVNNAIVDLPIRLKGNLKRISVNSLSPLGAQNKNIDAASQTLLTWFRLNL